MKRFVAGIDREQSTFLPECLDDFIDESNPVRVRVIQVLLGQSKVETTARYTHVAINMLRAVRSPLDRLIAPGSPAEKPPA